jgi:tetratricopeptide (TPR) repeat protein
MRQQHRALRIAVAAATLLSVAVSVYAQNNKWADPYQKGLKAVDAKKWDEAVADIEQAVAVEPKAEKAKYVEGVFRIDYFPYLYLGMAYMELKQYDKAQANFEKAKNPAPSDKKLQTRAADYQGQLTAALSKPQGPTVNAAFEPAVRRGEDAFAARRYPDALSAYDSAKGIDGAAYAKENVQVKRDEAARTFALQLVDEGRKALNDSLTGAKGKFQQADQAFAGLKDTADGLAEVKRREDQYAQLKTGAEQDITGSNWSAALAKLNQAKGANPEGFTADNLVARVNFVNTRQNARVTTPPVNNQTALADDARKFVDAGRLLASQGKYTEADASYASALQKDPNNVDAKTALDASKSYASLVKDGRSLKDKKGSAGDARKRFEDARTLDSQRFDRDGLGPILTALAKDSGQDPTKESLRQGLLALLKGDAQGSVSILEPALNQQPSGSTAASLHAYLGVAYATRALSSAKQDEQNSFNKVALEQFRLARMSQRDYKLVPRLVSPKILAMYDQASR